MGEKVNEEVAGEGIPVGSDAISPARHLDIVGPEDLKMKISKKTAAVYIENPSYLGFIETQGKEISDIAHDRGALSIIGVEPLSLGVLTPPGEGWASVPSVPSAQVCICATKYSDAARSCVDGL
jgi:glycine cleavage system pyridoxal-binding protein P